MAKERAKRGKKFRRDRAAGMQPDISEHWKDASSLGTRVVSSPQENGKGNASGEGECVIAAK